METRTFFVVFEKLVVGFEFLDKARDFVKKNI